MGRFDQMANGGGKVTELVPYGGWRGRRQWWCRFEMEVCRVLVGVLSEGEAPVVEV